MNNTQKHLLMLLQEIDDLCTEHNLKYFLAGGCFIGAYRHRGFLPWDDDADILMPIDDVIRLQELEADGKLPPNRTVFNLESFSAGLLWRYADTTTTALYRGTYPNKKQPHGKFVDIFVMYSGPDSESDRDTFLYDYRIARNLETIYVVFQDMSRKGIAELKRRWNPLSRYRAIKHIPAYSRPLLYNEKWKDSDSFFISSQNKPEFEKKELYDYPIRVPFENTELCVYERAKEVLSLVFGSNWVDIPTSPALRKPAHDIIMDLEFDYKTILGDIEQLNNFAITRVFDRGVKSAFIKHWGTRVDTLFPMFRLEVKLRAKEINRIWQNAAIDTTKMENEQYFTDAEYVLQPYYSTITWPRFTYWNLGLPVDDDVLWAAWYPQLQKGNYMAALKALRLARDNWNSPGQQSNPKLQRLYNDCVDADMYMDAFWSKEDYNLAKSIIARHETDPHPSIIFLRGSLAVSAYAASSTKDYKDLLELSNEAIDNYPGDGELAFWRGYALLNIGKLQEAMHCLRRAEDNAVNGIIRLYAKDLLCAIMKD